MLNDLPFYENCRSTDMVMLHAIKLSLRLIQKLLVDCDSVTVNRLPLLHKLS